MAGMDNPFGSLVVKRGRRSLRAVVPSLFFMTKSRLVITVYRLWTGHRNTFMVIVPADWPPERHTNIRFKRKPIITIPRRNRKTLESRNLNGCQTIIYFVGRWISRNRSIDLLKPSEAYVLCLKNSDAWFFGQMTNPPSSYSLNMLLYYYAQTIQTLT